MLFRSPESGPSIAHPGDDDGRASRHDHLSTLGVKKLKALAADCGVDLTGCCEKSEIVALLRVAYDAGTARANTKIKKAVAAMHAPHQEPWDFAADAKNSGGRKEPAKKKTARPPVTAEPVACAKVEDYFDGRGHKTDFATSAAGLPPAIAAAPAALPAAATTSDSDAPARLAA